MTYIEFYDSASVENVVSCLAQPPERVYLLGADALRLEKACRLYTEIFAQRGVSVTFIPEPFGRPDQLSGVVAALTRVLEKEPDCSIDLTGGADLCLVAVGIVAERFCHRNIQMHRFNLREHSVEDCDEDGNVIADVPAPRLTVEEYIRIYGGRVLNDAEIACGTHRWDMNDDFKQDIRNIWQISRGVLLCKERCTCGKVEAYRRWNAQVNVFAAMENFGVSKDLVTEVPMELAETRLLDDDRKEIGYVLDKYIRTALEKAGLCKIGTDGGKFRIEYKNAQVKRCLTKAGQALEMIVYLFAYEAKEDYTDVETGVYFDWDGVLNRNGNQADARNEVDAVMMHYLQPVFVSCKNGLIENPREELFMLNSIASRFGGSFAKRALIATSLNRMKNAKYVRERCVEMGITLIEPVEMPDAAFEEKIRTLWQ